MDPDEVAAVRDVAAVDQVAVEAAVKVAREEAVADLEARADQDAAEAGPQFQSAVDLDLHHRAVLDLDPGKFISIYVVVDSL